MKVTPDDIHQIHTYLTEQGLTTNEVRADVLDHICIMLEQQPDGLDRATVSALVEAEFPSQVIKQIQADTLYYLTLTSKITMLKFIFITGYVSVCLLVLGSFLLNHVGFSPDLILYWSPVLSITGMVVFCFGFLPTLFLYTYQRFLERVKQ